MQILMALLEEETLCLSCLCSKTFPEGLTYIKKLVYSCLIGFALENLTKQFLLKFYFSIMLNNFKSE